METYKSEISTIILGPYKGTIVPYGLFFLIQTSLRIFLHWKIIDYFLVSKRSKPNSKIKVYEA